MTSLRRADRYRCPVGRCHGASRAARRTSIEPEVRTPKGRPEGGRREPAPKRSRESDDRIRAMTSGNGWRPDPAEQRRSVLEESFERETCPSTDEE